MQMPDLFQVDGLFWEVKGNELKGLTCTLQYTRNSHFYLAVDLLLLAMKQGMCFGLLFSTASFFICLIVTQIERLTTDLLPKAQLKN